MNTPATALKLTFITLSVAGMQFASAQGSTHQVSAQGSYTSDSASFACDQAFLQAEQQALNKLDGVFDNLSEPTGYRSRLISQQESRQLESNGDTLCTFNGTWQGEALTTAEDLIGTEQYIDGQFTGSCLDEHNGDICWQRIVRQARAALYEELQSQYDQLDDIVLVYEDFEGRQRDQFSQNRLEMTADGRFFFSVVDGEQATQVSVNRRDSRPVTDDKPVEPPVAAIERKHTPREKDNVDVTLFYAFDGNDTAWADDLAISSNRWGVGVWANNQFGFAAFKGKDRIGIADKYQSVQDNRGYYETLGIGMGYRLWQTRGITVENMLYYVDAQPYSAVINPGNCTDCTPRTFNSRDYMQATVNLKTNARGVNFGWMFTWKFIEQQTNVDRLSSGLYLEIQM